MDIKTKLSALRKCERINANCLSPRYCDMCIKDADGTGMDASYYENHKRDWIKTNRLASRLEASILKDFERMEQWNHAHAKAAWLAAKSEQWRIFEEWAIRKW